MKHLLTRSTTVIIFVCLSLISFTSESLASGGARYRTGTVAAKGIVLSENGKPIWVEYNEAGDVAEYIGEADNELADAQVIPAAAYRAYTTAFAEVEALHSAYRKILYREEYQAQVFKNAAGQTIDKPQLKPTTRTVVVRTSDVLYSKDDLILLESMLDLKGSLTIPDDARAVLLSKDGRVLHTARVNIGYRTAFYTSADLDTTSGNVELGDPGTISLTNYRASNGDTLWAPVVGARVQSSLGRYPDVTDENGFYGATHYLPPCPGFSFFYDNVIMAQIFYQSFNPNSGGLKAYYATRPDWDMCSGYGEMSMGFTLGGLMTQIALMGDDMVAEGSAVIHKNLNMTIDAAMLSGRAEMRNFTGDVLPQGETEYTYDQVDFPPIVPVTDLNGDGQPDHTQLQPDDKTIYIWFPGSDPAIDPPDLERVADYSPDFTNQGLLKQISRADLINTDTFIYRVSNGQLYSSREGLSYLGDVSGTVDAAMHYRQMIRGPVSMSPYQTSLENWQAMTNVNPELVGRYVDHMRTGEQIEVFMINRATGYIGSGIGTFGENTTSGLFSFTPSKIILQPPNLKVRVERRFFNEAGLTADEENFNLIGFEGSGLTSDEVITITTEWYRPDGSPLPDDLSGYTGRLAKVVAPNVLGQASSQIANFPIKPGRHTAVVQLPQEEIDRAHFYIHISGENIDGEPDFSTLGAGDGLLEYRPKHYVPFKVPLYDDPSTQLAEDVRREAIDNGADSSTMPEVDPVYQWVYRPEMQFSVFDLELKAINRINEGEEPQNILSLETPVLSSDDDQVDFLYSLLEDELPMLESFGPDQVLVFALGEYELIATLGDDQTLTFDNLDYLSSLEPEDFLTISLYQNGDEANVLWEFAFLKMELMPGGDGVIEVSADESQAIVHALVMDGLTSDQGQVYRMQWQVEGDGVVVPSVESNTSGSFSTTLSLSTVAGTTARVVATIDDGSIGGSVKSAIFQVVPGEPASIDVEKNGETVIGGLGGINYTLTVRDQYGNLVEDGTPIHITAPDVTFDGGDVTTNGQIQFTITGSAFPGVKELNFQCGDVVVADQITVHDIAFTWDIPTTITIDQTVQANLTATSAFGNLDGLEVSVDSFRGRLSDRILTIVNGKATTSYYSEHYPGGAQLYARVGTSADVHEFTVEEAYDDLSIEYDIIVGNAISDGSFEVVTDDYTYNVGYKTSTNLTLTGNPGEVRNISLGSFGDPVMEPILNYLMDRLDVTGMVEDDFQGINAEALNVEIAHEHHRGPGTSFLFNSSTEVRTPTETILNLSNDVGFGFWFKPFEVNAPIVNYALRSQTLEISDDARLIYSVETTNGSFSVTSGPVNLNEWQEVGAAYKDGELVLEVGGQLFTTPCTGELVEQSVQHAIIIGQGFVGLMSDFRFNDWTKTPLVSFPSGGTTASVTFDATGKASLVIGSKGIQTTWLDRGYRKMQRAYARAHNKSIIRPAFAADLPPFCSEPMPTSLDSFESVENFINYLAECYYPRKMSEVKLRIKDTDFFSKERFIGIRDLAGYKALHIASLQAKSVISVVHCADGFITGAGDDATGMEMLCDFISGFLLYGDVRDFVMHSYHYHFGDRDNDFDMATYTLAGLGIVTNLLEIALTPTVAGGVAMAGADGAVAGLKSAVKIFRIADKAAPVMRFLTGFLNKKVFKAGGSLKGKYEALQKVMPIIELLAVVSFYHEEFAQIKDLLITMVKDEKDFYNLTNYVYGYFQYQASLVTTTGSAEDILNRYAETAHAVDLIPRRVPIEELLTLFNGLYQSAAVKRIKEFDRKLMDVIEVLETAEKNNIKELSEIMFENKTLVAFLMAREIGSKAAYSLRNYRGAMSVAPEKLLDDIAGIFEKLDEVQMADVALKEGFELVFKDLSIGFFKSSGAAHHFNFINDYLNKGFKLKGVEVEKKIYNSLDLNNPVGTRRYDAIIEIDGVEVFYDAKSWTPDLKKLEERFMESIQGKKVEVEDIDKGGQLYKDILTMFDKNNPKDIRWVFDHRNTGNEENIRNLIVKAVEANETKFTKALEIKNWDGFITKLNKKLETFVEVIPAS